MKFHHALTDAKLRGVKPKAKAFKLADGEGLHLLVMPAGKDGKPSATYWRYNYKIGGKAKTMALGTYPGTTLKVARELHYAASAIVKSGSDPMAQRRAEKVQAEEQATAAITFGAMADQWLTTMVPEDKRAGKTSTRDKRMVRYLKAAMGDVALPDTADGRGGVADSGIPNFIYRWTERDVQKTIMTYDPARVPTIKFFYDMRVPIQRFTRSGNRILRTLGLLVEPLSRLFAAIAPKQCNEFAFAVSKNGAIRPWISIERTEPGHRSLL